jgi:hypothetical protein
MHKVLTKAQNLTQNQRLLFKNYQCFWLKADHSLMKHHRVFVKGTSVCFMVVRLAHRDLHRWDLDREVQEDQDMVDRADQEDRVPVSRCSQQLYI